MSYHLNNFGRSTPSFNDSWDENKKNEASDQFSNLTNTNFVVDLNDDTIISPNLDPTIAATRREIDGLIEQLMGARQQDEQQPPQPQRPLRRHQPRLPPPHRFHEPSTSFSFDERNTSFSAAETELTPPLRDDSPVSRIPTPPRAVPAPSAGFARRAPANTGHYYVTDFEFHSDEPGELSMAAGEHFYTTTFNARQHMTRCSKLARRPDDGNRWYIMTESGDVPTMFLTPDPSFDPNATWAQLYNRRVDKISPSPPCRWGDMCLVLVFLSKKTTTNKQRIN